jgi:hypothetical protein
MLALAAQNPLSVETSFVLDIVLCRLSSPNLRWLVRFIHERWLMPAIFMGMAERRLGAGCA